MQTIAGIMQTMLWCGTILGVTLAVALSLPKSRLRDFLTPIVCWCAAIFCAAYAINPFDLFPEGFLGPFGLVDDAAALVGGFAAARRAMAASKD